MRQCIGGRGRRLVDPVMPVHQHDHVLHRDHSLRDHRFQVRQQDLDLLLSVNDLDHYWQVRGHLQEPGLVDHAAGPKPLAAPEHSRPTEAQVADLLNNRLIERLVLVLVGLANEDAKEDAVLVDLHVGSRFDAWNGRQGFKFRRQLHRGRLRRALALFRLPGLNRKAALRAECVFWR